MILATISYITYRSSTEEYVTSNLPKIPYNIIIICLFCINALASYPIQILCTFEIIEEYAFFNNPKDSSLKKSVKIYSERIIIVTLLTIFTSLIPNFIDFLNIVGTFGSATLGFIFPPMLLITFRGGIKKTKPLELAFNLFLIALGSIGGAYSIIMGIIKLAK